MNILDKHDIKMDNQGLAELYHILDYICDNCAHRWGEDVNGTKIRVTCSHCRLIRRPIWYKMKEGKEEWEEVDGQF